MLRPGMERNSFRRRSVSRSTGPPRTIISAPLAVRVSLQLFSHDARKIPRRDPGINGKVATVSASARPERIVDRSMERLIMRPFPHRYDVHLRSDSGPYASAQVFSAPDLRCTLPTEFGGPGDAWSPEHLLLAAVEACYLFTLRAIARASDIDILDCEIETSGTVDRQDGVTRFAEIVVSPSLTVAGGSDDERILWLLEKAKRTCLVSASLATPVRMNPVVTYERHAPVEPLAS